MFILHEYIIRLPQHILL